jgi:hypothetical protein
MIVVVLSTLDKEGVAVLARLTPQFALLPLAFPVRESAPLDIVICVDVPEILMPCDTPLLAPPVPSSVMGELEPVVLMVPPESEIPSQLPEDPLAVAVILIGWLANVVPKLAVERNAALPAPEAEIDAVAVIVPAVVKFELILTPFPPALPPAQFEKVTPPLPVKLSLKMTPWLIPTDPPEPEIVMSPDVAGIHGEEKLTPYEADPVAARAFPVILIGPDVEEIIFEPVPLKFTPELTPPPPDEVPLNVIVPLEVVIFARPERVMP